MNAAAAAAALAATTVFAASPAPARADSRTLAQRVAPASYWTVGVTLDRRITSRPFRGSEESIEQQSLIRDQLFGLSATYERSRFGINSRFVFLPQTLSPRTTLGFVTGARIRLQALGRDVTFGMNFQLDAVFGEHHWILYGCPAEIGIDVYSRHSFSLQLVAGARYAITGAVIRNVAIDPNGFPHSEFQRVTRDKLDNPLEGTISAVFARRID